MSGATLVNISNTSDLAGEGDTLNAPAVVYEIGDNDIDGESIGTANVAYSFNDNISGLVMEFADLEATVTTIPSYDVSLVQIAGLDVSALAVIDLSCDYHDVSGIFKFTFDSHDASNVDASSGSALVGADVSLEIDAQAFFNLLRINGKANVDNSTYTYIYGSQQGLQTGEDDDVEQSFLTPLRSGGSNSTNALYPSIGNVKWGNINTSYDVSQQQIWRDQLRHITNRVTGGYSALDLFANEEEMGAEIRGLDVSLNAQIATDICANAPDKFMADFANSSLNDADISNNRIRFMAYNLFRRMLSDAADSTNGDGTITFANDSLGKKFNKFITDLSNNSNDGTATYTGAFGFNDGDALAFKVNYIAGYENGNTPVGNNVITDHSYKIFIRLTVNNDTTSRTSWGSNFHTDP